MSRPRPSPLVRAVERWVASYTRGLPTEVRDARRAELRSDLFEHLRQVAGDGHGRLRRSLQVLGRVVRGMPDDLAWRFAQQAAARPAAEAAGGPRRQRGGADARCGAGGRRTRKAGPAVGGLLASVLLLVGIKAYAAWQSPLRDRAALVYLAISLASIGILVTVLMLLTEYARRWRRQRRGRSGRSPSP